MDIIFFNLHKDLKIFSVKKARFFTCYVCKSLILSLHNFFLVNKLYNIITKHFGNFILGLYNGDFFRYNMDIKL